MKKPNIRWVFCLRRKQSQQSKVFIIFWIKKVDSRFEIPAKRNMSCVWLCTDSVAHLLVPKKPFCSSRRVLTDSHGLSTKPSLNIDVVYWDFKLKIRASQSSFLFRTDKFTLRICWLTCGISFGDATARSKHAEASSFCPRLSRNSNSPIWIIVWIVNEQKTCHASTATMTGLVVQQKRR